MTAVVVGSVFSAFFTWILASVLSGSATRFGLLDHPGGRKRHTAPVPIVGGIAMATAISGVGLALQVAPVALLAAILVLLLAGAADDIRHLTPAVRFSVQILACLIMVYGSGIELASLGDLWGTGDLRLGPYATAFTVFGVVGVVNAYNMMDGADGLAGSLALIASVALSAAAATLGRMDAAAMMLIVAGALVGFLVLNLRHPWLERARIFMGDSGSMVIGFLVGWFGVVLTQSAVADSASRMPPVVVLWLCAVPLCDTVAVMFRRILSGRHPFKAGRDHLHHLLMDRGLEHGRAVAWIVGVAGVLAMLGMAAWRIGLPESLMFKTFLVVFVGYTVATSWAWRRATSVTP